MSGTKLKAFFLYNISFSSIMRSKRRERGRREIEGKGRGGTLTEVSPIGEEGRGRRRGEIEQPWLMKQCEFQCICLFLYSLKGDLIKQLHSIFNNDLEAKQNSVSCSLHNSPKKYREQMF